MSLTAINTRMTPLQFARTRSASRSIESNESMGKKSSSGRMTAMPMRAPAQTEAAAAREAVNFLPTPSIHFIYRAALKNGRLAAKRALQLADSDQWPSRINRMG